MDARLGGLFSRRSVRNYTRQPVSQDDIRALMEGATSAPSANNSRPWQFVTVTERDKLVELAGVGPYTKMVAKATLAVAVCADPEASAWWVQDCSAATQNLLLAASMIGLGGVWLGIHGQEEREQAVKKALGIPSKIRVLSLLSLGHPASVPEARSQYDPARVHRESW